MIIFPYFSHSQAAANEPRMLEITKDFVEIIDKVAYDSIASPVPVLSTTLFANDGSVKAGLFSSSFLTETIPLSPNFKIKFLNYLKNYLLYLAIFGNQMVASP